MDGIKYQTPNIKLLNTEAESFVQSIMDTLPVNLQIMFRNKLTPIVQQLLNEAKSTIGTKQEIDKTDKQSVLSGVAEYGYKIQSYISERLMNAFKYAFKNMT
jgi:hypothetical protein|nr:MAG TPA: hypothetical protein [Caudoviricetes sp.]